LRQHTLALLDASSIRDGLRRLADVMQAGILSPPVLQMRTLIAAEADTFPDVAADYVTAAGTATQTCSPTRCQHYRSAAP